jgi:hypothetical protein
MKRMLMLLTMVGFIALPVRAEITAKQTEVMKQLLVQYGEKAVEEAKNKKSKAAQSQTSFTVASGREFYLQRRSWQENDFTCSGCHTEDPRKEGKHIETKKPIKPLAPSANPERFTDVKKVEKNFTEHCYDLHDRDCRAYEKGNFLTYLMSVK